MKTFSLMALFSICFGSLTTFASENYTRGYIISVDTRSESTCRQIQKKIAAITTADVARLCDKNEKKPYTVIIATIPLKEFDYEMEEANLRNKVQDIHTDTSSDQGSIYILPKYKEFDHYLRFTSHPDHADITFSRQVDFAKMAENNCKIMIVPFIMKSDSEHVASETRDISASVGEYVVLNRGVYTRSQSEYLYIIKNQKNIVSIITEVIQNHAKDRVSFEFYGPSIEVCDPNYNVCPAGFNVGLKIKLNY